jgi:hypothetical protein
MPNIMRLNEKIKKILAQTNWVSLYLACGYMYIILRLPYVLHGIMIKPRRGEDIYRLVLLSNPFQYFSE